MTTAQFDKAVQLSNQISEIQAKIKLLHNLRINGVHIIQLGDGKGNAQTIQLPDGYPPHILTFLTEHALYLDSMLETVTDEFQNI